MNKLDIFITGVGGQGIGLLSEAIARAADYAGLTSVGADTHGLAQRGGIVTSHIRIGTNVHSVLISKGRADIVVSLERHEALRAMNNYLSDNGTLIFYNTSLQPLGVRLGKTTEVETKSIYSTAEMRNIKVIEVYDENIENEKFQNIALLAALAKHTVVPHVKTEHYYKAMADLMNDKQFQDNLKVFNRISGN